MKKEEINLERDRKMVLGMLILATIMLVITPGSARFAEEFHLILTGGIMGGILSYFCLGTLCLIQNKQKQIQILNQKD